MTRKARKDFPDLGIENLEPGELRKLIEAGNAKREAKEKYERTERDDPTGVYCRACGGEIVQRMRLPRIRRDRHTPIGGRTHIKWVVRPAGWNCGRCGIEYHRLPESKR